MSNSTQPNQNLESHFICTQVGNLEVHINNETVQLCKWTTKKPHEETNRSLHKPVALINLEQQLKEYFNGKRKTFDVPYNAHGTDFQKSVWDQLTKIKYGRTISYQDIATSLNKPNSFRAVANACGANPLSILVPCHRVLRSNGELGGYFGGVEVKQYLLNLECKSL